MWCHILLTQCCDLTINIDYLSFAFGGCTIFFVMYKMTNSSDGGIEIQCKIIKNVHASNI